MICILISQMKNAAHEKNRPRCHREAGSCRHRSGFASQPASHYYYPASTSLEVELFAHSTLGRKKKKKAHTMSNWTDSCCE